MQNVDDSQLTSGNMSMFDNFMPHWLESDWADYLLQANKPDR